MDSDVLAVIVGSVLVASVVQTVSGFGFALLCVPLMTFAVDTRTAVVVSSLTGVGVTVAQAWRLRAHADRQLARRLTLAAYAGMPLGLAVFSAVSERTLLRLLGVSVLGAVVLLVAGIDLRQRGRGLELGAGFLSGILSTSVSTNGPPLVFALQSRRLAADPFRATIATVFAWANVGAVGLFLAAGKVTLDGVTASAVSIPALILGQRAGQPLRRRVQGERFRWLVLGLLTAVGVRAVVASF